MANISVNQMSTLSIIIRLAWLIVINMWVGWLLVYFSAETYVSFVAGGFTMFLNMVTWNWGNVRVLDDDNNTEGSDTP
jgi:hypothetical protein